MIDTSKIKQYVSIGKRDFNWYQDCSDTFIDLYGEENLTTVCKLFAATSINTSMKGNITLFRRAFYEITHGLPIGTTGGYLPIIKQQLENVRLGLPLTGRKINAFSVAMDRLPESHMQVVVDVWLTRAFGVDRKYFRQSKGKAKGVGMDRDAGVSDGLYTIIEEWCRDEAMRMGIEPRQLSAMIWAGVRISTNGDRRTHYKEILRSKAVNLFGVI